MCLYREEAFESNWETVVRWEVLEIPGISETSFQQSTEARLGTTFVSPER